MKNINEKNQCLISKMETSLKPFGKDMDIYTKDAWFHTRLDSENIAVPFEATYTFSPLNCALKKGVSLSLAHTGAYQCSTCQKSTKKIVGGFCYVCLMKKAVADRCVMNPYQCHFAMGTCREPQWALGFCYQPHYVYLAFTDKYKVGITRKGQILTRWTDQGATMAAPIALLASRHQAGVVEKALTEILSDRSHWQKMLKSGNDRPGINSFLEKFQSVQEWLKDYLTLHTKTLPPLPPESIPLQEGGPHENLFFENPSVVEIHYPAPDKIEKIKSISLEKEKEFKGIITGIKGQYLFFEDRVFNMRSHEGFLVEMEIN
jgi:hypothetical protein